MNRWFSSRDTRGSCTDQPCPAPPPSKIVDGVESGRQLLKKLEELARKGGTFSTNPEVKPYAFCGSQHMSTSQAILDSLWKFGFSEAARNVLGHVTVHHDDQALVLQQDFGV